MIYIYDRDFVNIGVCENYTSLIWRRRYYEVGSFELHFPVGADDYSWLKKDMLIRKEGDNVFGVIQDIEINLANTGIEVISIKGALIDSYIGKRIIWGMYNFNNRNIEDVIHELFTSQISSPSDPKRKIDRFIMKRSNTFHNSISLQVSYDNLQESIQCICRDNELGFRSVFDFEEEVLYFELYKGLDRTIEQDINDQVIFSKEFDNVLTQKYVLNTSDYKNITLVAGEGEGAARKLITVGDTVASGLDRNELYTDARDLQKENNTDLQYEDILIERGKSKLNDCSIIENFNANLNINANLKYKNDYDLGDKVSFVDTRFGLVINKRIVEIEEIYENSMLTVNSKFGDEKLTLLKRIRRGM